MEILDLGKKEKVLVEEGDYALRIPSNWYAGSNTILKSIATKAWISPFEVDEDNPVVLETKFERWQFLGRKFSPDELMKEQKRALLAFAGIFKTGTHHVTSSKHTEQHLMKTSKLNSEYLDDVFASCLQEKPMTILSIDSMHIFPHLNLKMKMHQLTVTDYDSLMFNAVCWVRLNQGLDEHECMRGMKKILDSLILNSYVK